MKKFGCLALLIALLFGGIGIWRAFNPPRPPTLAQLPPAEQQKRREEAHDLVQQIEAIGAASQASERRRFVLTAREEQLNTLVQDRLKVENLAVSDLRVSLEPRTLVVTGTARYQGLNVPIEMRGQPVARGGRIFFDISSLTLGGLNAPREWKENAQTEISAGLSELLRGDPNVRVEEVEVRADSLTLFGRTG